MKIYYISPSEMPSRRANSIHVIRMCEALASQGNKVTLFICRTMKDSSKLRACLEETYGVSLKGVTLISFHSNRWPIALNLRIAIMAFFFSMVEALRGQLPDIVISRNLYAAFLCKWIFRGRMIFEFHEVENGFRKYIQKVIVKDNALKKVFISESLLKHMNYHHEYAIRESMILPDAAPAGIDRFNNRDKIELRKRNLAGMDINKYSFFVGYFGHLYKGKGAEIVQALAEQKEDIAFFIYGGNEDQIRALRRSNKSPNLMVMGHIDPGQVLESMGMMDALLMPCQKSVSIGGRNRSDISPYMSPMKMFEYMAVGVPIISSRLDVLEEVLSDGRNCLMAEPEDLVTWSSCLERLKTDVQLSDKLARTAHEEYKQLYTWNTRAQKMIRFVSK